jgi:hypothetical protein
VDLRHPHVDEVPEEYLKPREVDGRKVRESMPRGSEISTAS